MVNALPVMYENEQDEQDLEGCGSDDEVILRRGQNRRSLLPDWNNLGSLGHTSDCSMHHKWNDRRLVVVGERNGCVHRLGKRTQSLFNDRSRLDIGLGHFEQIPNPLGPRRVPVRSFTAVVAPV